MSYFITPVSMQVTEEQFERYLKEPLKELGYVIDKDITIFRSAPILVNNFIGHKGRVCNVTEANKTAFKRYYITHYNPKLFLALAAMTNVEYGKKGEWWIRTGEDTPFFTKNKLYKQVEDFRNEEIRFLDDTESYHNWNKLVTFKNKFRKATKEEIITYFSKNIMYKFPITINKNQAEEIIDMVCSSWKVKLAEKYGKDLLVYKEVAVSFDLYEEGYKAANRSQRKVLDNIFGKNDNNPFRDDIKVKSFSKINDSLFDDRIFALATDAVDLIDRPDLRYRAIYVKPGYKVIVHEKEGLKGSIIEITEKGV